MLLKEHPNQLPKSFVLSLQGEKSIVWSTISCAKVKGYVLTTHSTSLNILYGTPDANTFVSVSFYYNQLEPI